MNVAVLETPIEQCTSWTQFFLEPLTKNGVVYVKGNDTRNEVHALQHEGVVDGDAHSTETDG